MLNFMKTTIKCRKCGKVYPVEDKICPNCGYDIREDETLSARERALLAGEDAKPQPHSDPEEIRERWEHQTKEERQKEAWENRNKLEIRPDQSGIPRLNIPLNSMIVITVLLVVVVVLMRVLS